jgi:hypothetical protein
MLIQTLALFLDAYRELNSKKLFWLTMILSGLVVLAFAAIGINAQGVTLLWWDLGDLGFGLTTEMMSPADLYKTLFSSFGIALWLSWIATILALVSTAGIIPSFIAGGAVELTLSKPISRVRLFLTKFMTGLLFSALQVSVFTVACFLVIGIRGNSWEPGMFLAIPLVVIFYSYLFSICALLGLLTRSTIAALLLTLLCWLFFFSLNATDGLLVQFREANAMRVEQLQDRIKGVEANVTRKLQQEWANEQKAAGNANAMPAQAPAPTPDQIDARDSRLTQFRIDLSQAQKGSPRLRRWSSVVTAVKTIFPKTSETISLLERSLKVELNLPGANEQRDPDEDPVNFTQGRVSQADQREIERRVRTAFESRSVGWVLGTSLVFEGLVLLIACWIFARRDF